MLASLLLSCALVLAPQEGPTQPQSHFTMMLYEARDIVERIGPDFPARKIGTSRPARSGLLEGGVPLLADIPLVGSALKQPAASDRFIEELARVAAGSRVLESTVSRLILPKAKDAAFNLRCTDNGTFVLTATAPQHEWVSAFFDHLRKYDKLVEVEARFVRVPGERLKELGIEGTSVFPKPEDVPTLLEALKQTPKVEFMSAPRVVVLPLQRASISVLDQVRYVGDWRVETVEPGAQEVLVPEIEELETGLALDVRAVPLPGEKLALTLEAQEARLARPLVPFTEKLKTKKGEVEVAIALPDVAIQRVQTELLLQDGSTAVLVVDPSSSKDRLVIVVTVRSVAAK
jgi:hypothetical protein